jgi:hypothetical protein
LSAAKVEVVTDARKAKAKMRADKSVLSLSRRMFMRAPFSFKPRSDGFPLK